MALSCPICDATIPPKNIHLEKPLARCRKCGHVFAIPARKSKKHKVQQPKRLRVKERGNRLELSYHLTTSLGTIIGVIAPSVVALALSFFFLAALSDPTAPVEIVAMLGLMVFPFWYYVAASFINTTRIIADEKTLTARNGPLPVPFSKQTVRRQVISRVYCEETVLSSFSVLSNRYYHVWVGRVDRDPVPFQLSLPQDYAFFVVHMLNDYLTPEKDDDRQADG